MTLDDKYDPRPLSPEEEQRRSFAYGNLKLSNPAVTRELVDRAADEQEAEKAAKQEESRRRRVRMNRSLRVLGAMWLPLSLAYVTWLGVVGYEVTRWAGARRAP